MALIFLYIASLTYKVLITTQPTDLYNLISFNPLATFAIRLLSTFLEHVEQIARNCNQ